MAEAPVALLGGTFDPVHYGHLFAAEAVGEALGLDRVLFVPAGSTPHRNPSAAAPAEHRLAMVRLACAGNPRFEVSDIEVRRPGPSYTFDTVAELERESGHRVTLVLGADAFLLVQTWHMWEELLARVDLVLVSRPGYADDAARRLAEDLGVRPTLSLARMGVAVSGTELRERIASGLSVRYLVPDEVIRYIEEHGLYRP